jgi:hypothetical protein
MSEDMNQGRTFEILTAEPVAKRRKPKLRLMAMRPGTNHFALARCLARYTQARRRTVTARLLPRRFCFDASDEQLVVNKAVEEVVPVLG